MITRRHTWTCALTLLLATGTAQAADLDQLLVIRNHRFEPAELKVPAGQRIKLTVHNQDDAPQEYESHRLNREKLIPGGARASLHIGPLKPGRYGCFGECNPAIAQGNVLAQ